MNVFNSLQPMQPSGIRIELGEAEAMAMPAALARAAGRLRQRVREHGLVLIRGLRGAFDMPSALLEFASRLGQPMQWEFGAVLDLKEHADARDMVFAPGHMPFHWDGTVAATTPELFMLYCVEAPGSTDGGRTLFTDTRRLLASLDEATLCLWRGCMLAYEVNKVAHYGGTVFARLVDRHPRTGEEVLRYVEPEPPERPLLNAPRVHWHGVTAAEAATVQQQLARMLHAPAFCHAHAWRPGDLVLVDNFALLHAREPFASGAPRRLLRVQLHADPVFHNCRRSD